METLVNDIIKGGCCEKCNQYFEHPTKDLEFFEHGYPVVCRDCWEQLTEAEKNKHLKAESNLM